MAGLSAYLACVPDVIPASNEATMYQTGIERADQIILKTVAAYGVSICHRTLPPPGPNTRITIYGPTVLREYIQNGTPRQSSHEPGRPRQGILLPPLRQSQRRARNGLISILNTSHGIITDRPHLVLISAVAAAHGPLHFGATESAQRTLYEIREPKNVPAFMEEVKAGKRKLFGYGHRTYKGMDPACVLFRVS